MKLLKFNCLSFPRNWLLSLTGAQQLRLGAQEQSNAAESNQIQPSSSSNAEAQAADVDQEQSGSNGEDTDASLEEQDRIAGLVTEGIMLVDAALGHGHEGNLDCNSVKNSHPLFMLSPLTHW